MTDLSGNETKHKESIIRNAGSRRVRRPGSKRQLKIIIWIIMVISGAIVVSYFLLRPEPDTYQIRDYASAVVEVRDILDDIQLGGTVRARTEATIRAPVTGILESVEVDVGDWVSPGEIVAVLGSDDLQNSYESLQADLAQSERAFENLLLSREHAILIGRRQRAQLLAILEQATNDRDDALELFRLGTITTGTRQNAEVAASDAEKALFEHDEDEEIAGRFHEIAKRGAEDNLDIIRSAIVDVERQIVDTRISAAIEGQIVWTIDTIEAVGEKINESAPILRIADTRDPFIETSIEEQYVNDIATGQEVVTMIMGREFTGFVERIGLLAETPITGGAPEVELDIGVDAVEIEVIPGSTALVEIIVGEVSDALVLPRGPYLSTGNNMYLYKIDGQAAVRTGAAFGAITEQYVEVISGVSEGDEIITSSYQNYIDFENIVLGGNHD